jgi:hypothetical protein
MPASGPPPTPRSPTTESADRGYSGHRRQRAPRSPRPLTHALGGQMPETPTAGGRSRGRGASSRQPHPPAPTEKKGAAHLATPTGRARGGGGMERPVVRLILVGQNCSSARARPERIRRSCCWVPFHGRAGAKEPFRHGGAPVRGIHDWTTAEVFAAIEAGGQKPHYAYSLGNERLHHAHEPEAHR